MGASDYMVGNAPGGVSYAAPLVGFQIGQAIGNLPEDYFNAQQRKLQQAKQNAFPNGMPLNPDGTPDVNAVMNKGMKLGGLDYAAPLMNMMMGQQAGQQAARNISNIDDGLGGGQSISRPSGPAAGPANLTPNPPRPQPPTMAPGTYAQEGQDSVQSLATEAFGGRDVTGLINGVAKSLGVNPAAPLNPQQLAQAKAVMARAVGQGQQQGAQQNGMQAAPVASGGASGAAAPPPGTAPETAAPASGIMPNAPQTEVGPASGLVPPGYDPRAFADALRKRAVAMRSSAAGIAPFNPATATQYEKQADAYDARAKLIDEAIGKGAELTPEQKNASASGIRSPLDFENRKIQGKVAAENTALTPEQKNAAASAGLSPLDYQRRQEIQKKDIDAGEKTYTGLQQQADQAHQLVQTLRLNQSLMDDPNFYSGVGEEYNLLWKRLKASMGLDPNAALPQEAFRKTVSSAILDQIRSLGGQGLGQIRVAEIKVMQSAAQNQDNTPAANRLLSEIQMRLANRWTLPMAEMAQEYKQQHGYLDAGWDKLKTKYLNDTPLFSEAEIKDTRRIAPPLARTPADLKKIGWKDGEPFRTPDGRVLTHIAAPGTP